MRRAFVFLLSVFFTFFLSISFSYAGSLQVTALTPMPNYSGSSGTIDNLTDGVTWPTYIWVRSGGLGWDGKRLVAIDLSNTSPSSGHLDIHVGYGANAGVYVPTRFDVYGSADGLTYNHLAGVTPNQANYTVNGNSYWVHLPTTQVFPYMVIMVAANGQYIMMDEINWMEGGQPVSASSNPLSRADIPADSIQQMKYGYWAADVLSDATKNGWLSAYNSVQAWIAPTWSPLSRFPTTSAIQDQQAIYGSTITFKGLPQDKTSACIGLLNPTANDVTVSLSSDSSVISISQLQPVLAANGTIVHDPVVPLSLLNNSLTLKAYQATYVWVTADLNQLDANAVNTSIVVTQSGGVQLASIPVNLERVVAQRPVAAPSSTVWAYAKEWPNTYSPIWSNPTKTLDDLIAHDTTIHVIQNQSMPAVNDLNNAIKIQRLTDEVNLYKGHGRIILYMGWSSGNPSSSSNTPMLNWVGWINNFMASMGLSNDDWALYPFDEPRGSPDSDATGLGYLKNLITTIKAVPAYSQIKFFANPTSDTKTPLLTSQLDALSGLIDWWQPAYALFDNSLAGTGADTPEAFRAFFNGLHKPWAVFHNPGSPAKTALPLNHYLLMGWNAYTFGASGTGFWSYSDIQYGGVTPASAWDDFDSTRPDWAVVYENKFAPSAGPISSRRWEAYRQGLQDLNLINNVAATGNTSALPTANTVPNDDISLISSRETLLSQLKELYADLSIIATTTPNPVSIYGQVNYNLSVRNLGPSNASGVVLSAPLPAGITFISASSGCTGVSTVTCNIGNLASGTSTNLIITVATTATGSFSSIITVTGNDFDPDIANNNAIVTTTVTQGSQTITVTTAAPASAIYGSTFTVAATSSSGLPVAITATGGCSIAGGTVTMTSGTIACTVNYNQVGNANYTAATQVSSTTASTKASQTISVTTAAPASAIYDSSFTVAATSSSGLPVVISIADGCTNVGSTVTMTSGTTACTVTYNQVGDSNYTLATQVSSITTAAKVSQAITVTTAAPSTTPKGSSFQVAATASSGLTVAISASPSTVCSFSVGTVTTTKRGGTCTVSYNQSGNANYSATPQLTSTTTVKY